MKKGCFKYLIRKITPYKLRYFIRIIRNGRFREYITEIKQFKNDKNYIPSDFPLYLSIAAIVKNETPYIAEWIEYHLLVGVQKFFIYDNESTDNLREYLESYIKDGIVEYTYFSGKRQQLVAYNEIISRYKYSSFWIVFIDIDEFLVPILAETISEFLHDFEDIPGIEINQMLYGSSGHLKKTAGLVIERFKDHSPYDHPINRGVKSIVNPRYVFYMATAHVAEYYNGEHSVSTEKIKNIEGSLDRLSLHDKMRINHYGVKSLEEFTSRIDLGRTSSPGKLPIKEFFNRDHNEIKNDAIMDKYIPIIKENLKKKNEAAE
ncbi:MAG: glycosyltransferase family 92 protein [Treponema sp.]|jgi:hypothetical protein|nr:glycosyltransferase family 92 protein [Treponema sp.]